MPRSRRALCALLTLGFSTAVMGCMGHDSLSILGPGLVAVGEPSTFYISSGTGCGKTFGGPSDPTGDLCSNGHGVTKLIDATCDGGACAVESAEVEVSNDLIVLHLVGTLPGPTVLHVRAALSDGSALSATSPVSFVTATGLHLGCAMAEPIEYQLPPYGQCGGHYPVFTGSTWKWTVSFDSDSGPVGAESPSFAVQGDAVTFDSANGWFQSGSTTGMVEVVVSTRQLTKTVPVRVVSTADVVRGELRTVTWTDGIDAEIAQIGPAPSTLWYPTRNSLRFEGDTDQYHLSNPVEILPLLTLSDGTQAYGGGGLFASDHPDVCTLPPFETRTNLLQQTEVQPDCRMDGSATFTATIGAASIAWPVVVAPPPPAAAQ